MLMADTGDIVALSLFIWTPGSEIGGDWETFDLYTKWVVTFDLYTKWVVGFNNIIVA